MIRPCMGRDLPCVDAPTFKDVPRSVRSQFDDLVGPKTDPPGYKTDPPGYPPRILKKFHREAMSHELGV